jgi:hypothetical protein
MVFTQHFTDDAGGFTVGSIGTDSHIVHRIENPAVNWLETIASIRQGPGDDYTHSIIEISRSHLIVNINSLDSTDIHNSLS